MARNEQLKLQQALAGVSTSAFNLKQAEKLPAGEAKGKILETARDRANSALQTARASGLSAAQVRMQIEAAHKSAELKVPPTRAQMENSLGITSRRRTNGLSD